MKRTLVLIARVAVLGAGILFSVAPAQATEVRIFQVQTGADFRAGTLSGIALDPGGFLDLAPRVERMAALDEPFVLSAVAIPGGWAVGTGNDGKVLRVTAKGEVSVLFDAPEPEVFALWADADGTLFAGTSPNGKVYRIATSAKGKSGSPEAKPFFDPGATYIWAIRRAADGALLVATGTEGKLFRVDGEGKGKVFYDADEPHIRSLLPLPASAGGDVVVGTSGEGLVVRIAKDGSARTLFDAAEPEVAALALGPDGTIYAALVASEASLVPTAGAAPSAAGGGGPAAGGPGPGAGKPGEPTVTVSIGEPEPASKKDGAPRSEVVAIATNGLAEGVGSFADETVFDLLWQDRLWVATGLEGKLYSFRPSGTSAGRMQLEKDTDERQLVALVAGAAGPTIATTNGSALYRTTAELERQGTFTGAVLDAGAPAKFGRLRWRGEVPAGTSVSFSVRSGASANPDRTWSPWSPWKAVASRDEIALSDADGAPAGRYLQWRAQLSGASSSSSGDLRSPRIAAVELSYRQLNQRPKIEAFGALPPGQILVPQNFNPSNQVFEPVHPNREGLFTTLAPADEIDDSGRLKPLWKLGYRSLRWKASDPNGDSLRYRLTFRPAGKGVGEDTGAALGQGPDGEAGWLKLADDLSEEYLSFDVGALPDGLYRFRLEATDADANDAGEGLSAEEMSPALTVDHSPPTLAGVEADGTRLRVTVEDAWSPVRDAQVSVDGGEWQPARAADGLLDGRREELILEVPVGARYLLLRTTDGAYNAATFDLTGKIAGGKGR
ncbi:MAG TPA: hypothetical protein VGS22_08500 [Thermoanaerobaculia bacterium]|jgi:hypothetical protein|nr:hypothetical protein [Thermoanaerobaculia bacterium]